MADSTSDAWGSLFIIEELTGSDLDPAEAERLARAPDEQIAFFINSLAPIWYDWLEEKGTAARLVDEKPLYLPSHPDRDSSGRMSAASYKRAALFFDKIAVPDPLAEALHPAVESASLFGAIDVELARPHFREGLLRLAEVAPMIRAGAFVLVPDRFGGLHPLLQKHAREEMANLQTEDTAAWKDLARHSLPNASDKELDDSARYLGGQFAVAMAWLATTGSWPITSAPHIFDQIQKGIARTADKAPDIGMRAARAITFQLPDGSGIDPVFLARIRENDENFAELRNNITMAVLDASKGAYGNPRDFSDLLRDRLEKCAEDCRKAAGFSSALDGIWAPTLASLTLAAATIQSSHGDPDPTRLALEVVAPGAAWLVTQVARSFSAEPRSKRRMARLYGSLVQGL